jgi:Cu(I)/Ag(I) efflux system membrane fusion protein
MTDTELREGKEAPPRGVAAMAAVRWAILAVVALAAFTTVYSAAAPPDQSAGHQHAPRYHCPMHPEITSDAPGECPICHMTLELIPEERKGAPAAASPQHARPAGSAGPGAPPPLPPDTAPVTLELDRIQAVGVRTDTVESTTSTDPLRVSAVLEAPERSAAEVHVRTPGFLETVAGREVGARVHAGEQLATVFSTAVFQAEQELLAVLEWKQGGGGSRPPVEDARRRLELLGVPRATVDRIVETRQPVRAIGVAAPIDGYVVRRSAVLGAYVVPEASLFDIVGLDRVYVVASVPPALLLRVKVGDGARFSTPALPGRTFDAKVDLVYPTVDPDARTARVRFSLKNADLSLRPGQVGTAEFAAAAATELTVPLDAVIDTGRAAYVFLAEGEGRFSPRAVSLGEARGERVAVQGDLRAGDRVVSRATFLIDSESRLRASFARSTRESAALTAPAAPAAPAPHVHGGAP